MTSHTDSLRTSLEPETRRNFFNQGFGLLPSTAPAEGSAVLHVFARGLAFGAISAAVVSALFLGVTAI